MNETTLEMKVISNIFEFLFGYFLWCYEVRKLSIVKEYVLLKI